MRAPANAIGRVKAAKELRRASWRPEGILGGKCSTDENPSDLLTKAIVSPTKFDKFARWIMGNRDSSVLAFFAGVRRRSVLRVFKSGVEVTRLRLR